MFKKSMAVQDRWVMVMVMVYEYEDDDDASGKGREHSNRQKLRGNQADPSSGDKLLALLTNSAQVCKFAVTCSDA